MINLLTMEEIARTAVLSLVVCVPILGGFFGSLLVYREVIKDLRRQIKELNETMHVLSKKHEDEDGHTRL